METKGDEEGRGGEKEKLTTCCEELRKSVFVADGRG